MRASSAARRNAVATEDQTSSHPAAALLVGPRPTSAPVARGSAGSSRSAALRSTASAVKTRRRIPFAQHLCDPARRLGRLHRGRCAPPAEPPGHRSLRSLSDGAAHRGIQFVSNQVRDRCRPQPQEVLTLPDGPGSGLATPTVCQPSRPPARRRSGRPSARSRGSLTTPPAPTWVLADLELRLHHGNDIGVRLTASGQCGQHRRQRDERQVGDGGSTGPPIASGVRSRTLVRSITRTRGSDRSDQASWP